MANSQRRNNRYSSTRRGSYVYGNAVSVEETKRRMEQPYEVVDARVMRNRARANRMGLREIAGLSVACFILCCMLISYLQTQAQLTVSMKRVASMESELNNLRMSNNEELNRIEASVNLEEIKRIAVEELGMTYAKTGQVVTISDEGSDYVRQLKGLPND